MKQNDDCSDESMQHCTLGPYVFMLHYSICLSRFTWENKNEIEEKKSIDDLLFALLNLSSYGVSETCDRSLHPRTRKSSALAKNNHSPVPCDIALHEVLSLSVISIAIVPKIHHQAQVLSD